MLTPEELEQETLYRSLSGLGRYYALDITVNAYHVNDQLNAHDKDWKQYNPRKPEIARQGLSLTSLDGQVSGIPD